MSHHAATSYDAQLKAYRHAINEYDRQLLNVLTERAKIVHKVGTLKAQRNEHRCYIRPGREAEIIRNVAEALRETDFPPGAGATIWRTIIGASTSLEQSLRIGVYVPDTSLSHDFWLAREYFGPFLTYEEFHTVDNLLYSLRENSIAVAIFPDPEADGALIRRAPWWQRLWEQGDDDRPQIFARLPFVRYPGETLPESLAVAYTPAEPTGDDDTLIVLEGSRFLSRSAVSAHLERTEYPISIIAESRIDSGDTPRFAYLLRAEGFIHETDGSIDTLSECFRHETHALSLTVIGNYARPLLLE